ncbi:hypothetical protein [Pyruvatibacter mobilis]|uniref:DUF2834 domain-containing protein n=1 Tax=Pyruvatibacter mobilis TaxID=1712261 RepID=A0A845QEM6_9HYPH|nr:hypothetical protein [Pyruvatibacter mobilis]NBG96758.1 hypothetical protein [Pyruvatibacter mobilis]QJD74249.1 hypothetical protein HG718_01825 [Pyruvatibacter mobilis]GGD05302.1 hypothetical protein GCM10011587_06510 [Pyruvatibacter mobilis]
MQAFRIYLVLLIVVLFSYTAVVAVNHGLGLYQIFFGDIAAMGWPGQFNLDFLMFLTLSGLWLAWRHHFSPGGIVLGIIGTLFGMAILAPYLLWASIKANGDIKVLFLGEQRAAAS